MGRVTKTAPPRAPTKVMMAPWETCSNSRTGGSSLTRATSTASLLGAVIPGSPLLLSPSVIFTRFPGDQQRHLRNLGFAFPDFCADLGPRPSCDTHENQQRHQGDLDIAFPDLVVDSSPCAARCPTAGPVAATPPLSLGHAPPPKVSSKDQPASKHGHHRVHKVALGIPWEPHEFVEQALRAGHPHSLLDGAPLKVEGQLGPHGRNVPPRDWSAPH